MRTLTPIHSMACSDHSTQEQGGHGQAFFEVSHLCGVDQALGISVLLSGHPRQAAAPLLRRSIDAYKFFHTDGSADCEGYQRHPEKSGRMAWPQHRGSGHRIAFGPPASRAPNSCPPGVLLPILMLPQPLNPNFSMVLHAQS